MGLCEANNRKAKDPSKRKNNTGKFDINELKNDLIMEIIALTNKNNKANARITKTTAEIILNIGLAAGLSSSIKS